jgi:hypothetical protein
MVQGTRHDATLPLRVVMGRDTMLPRPALLS